MVSKKVMVGLMLVYVMSLLAGQTEGFVPFFTQSDFWKMQEKERNNEQKKSLTPLQQLEEEGISEQPGADVNRVSTIQLLLLIFLLPPQLSLPVKAGMWLISRQLEKYHGALEKLLTEVLQDAPDG
ncbi:MOTI protein, partial [Chauna torquata]|nr:MOTI protein [Chauna torquata]